MVDGKYFLPTEKTYALLVGIEQYDMAPGNNIAGPATDAAHFTRWLMGRGVPVGNITTFLSSLPDRQRLVKEACPADFTLPTRENIDNYITKTLRSASGDLLFVYWASHGVEDFRSNSRKLILSDATDNAVRNLNFDGFLKALSSNYFSGFEKQILLIEACAPFTDTLQNMHYSDLNIPVGASRPVEQMVMYAATPGTLARVENASCVFSGVLLEELEKVPTSIWPPDWPAIHQAVRKRFDDLRDRGELRQTPSLYSFKDFSGTEEVRKYYDDLGHLSSEQIRRIITDALLGCSAIRKRSSRETILANLPFDIQTHAIISGKARDDVNNLVEQCQNFDCLPLLLEVVKEEEGKTLAWMHVEKIAVKIGIPVRP